MYVTQQITACDANRSAINIVQVTEFNNNDEAFELIVYTRYTYGNLRERHPRS